MTNPTADPLVGRTVAHYQIVSRLGGGGMGIVYRAIDRKLDRPVAVKFLPPQWSHDAAAKERFIREARAASATHHPNICTIHDIETADDGQLFIVMAYYEGPTLKQRLESGPLPVDDALDIATQVADGLAKAHAQGVVHRDIKPGNLILTEDGVRIVDFGLATFADALQLTTSGSALGTAAYMSPEQSRGEEADARTDVWALGVVLYEMLSGHVPFRGSYAEAITYAIRNDPPLSLRAERPDIPEDVEQLVFRAVHKDRNIRYHSGRELARALRQVRGVTVPQDLRTQLVPAPAVNEPPLSRYRSTPAAAAVAALLVGAPAWLLVPIDPVTVAVMPVVNQTGFTQLDGLEFALQDEMSAALDESAALRRVPPDRLREVLRPYRDEGTAIGVDALQALAEHSRSDYQLVPVLTQDDGMWSASVAVRRPGSGVPTATLTAGPIASTRLPHDTAYQLILQTAALVEEYFVREGPVRGRVKGVVRRVLNRAPPAGHFATLSAAAVFERGLEAYDRMEYADALRAFTEAAELDPRTPLPEAWRSRTALVMRRDPEAVDAAGRAARLGTDSLHGAERLFVEAVVAEALRDHGRAETAYARLLDEDERAWTLEWGAYLDRRGEDEAAILAYQRALVLEPASGRPELELCRLYGPSRTNQKPLAMQHAMEADRKFAAVGSRLGAAQVAMCRVDILRTERDPKAVAEAREAAESARVTLERLNAPYQYSRALYYLGLAAYAARDFSAAASWNEDALAAADKGGNIAIEPLILQNLGVSHLMLGNRRRHIELTRASAELLAARGDVERAAAVQANLGATLIDYDTNPAEGLRLVQNALQVSRASKNTNGEVFALQVSAAYERNLGRHAAADALLSRAISLAGQSATRERMWSLQLDRARSLFDLADYGAARRLIVGAMETIPERDRTQGQIWLALVDTRLGKFDDARTLLAAVASRIGASDATNALLVQVARGELEYEADSGAAARHFRPAARSFEDDLPHARVVEAHAYAGLLQALSGDAAAGAAAVQRSLAHAQQMGRLALETRCRIFLARIDVHRRRYAEALEMLGRVPPDDAERTVGPELRAQVHYWTAAALRGRGDLVDADRERQAAREVLGTVLERLSGDERPRFAARVDVRRVLESVR